MVGVFGLVCKTIAVSNQSEALTRTECLTNQLKSFKPIKSRVITNRYLAYARFRALCTSHSASTDWLIALAVWLLRPFLFQTEPPKSQKDGKTELKVC